MDNVIFSYGWNITLGQNAENFNLLEAKHLECNPWTVERQIKCGIMVEIYCVIFKCEAIVHIILFRISIALWKNGSMIFDRAT